MPTARDLTADDMERYRAAARQRAQREREALTLRERRAWELARQAATLLRQEFQAQRVVVFGSLTHPGTFTPWSDVDVAAYGLNPRETLRAMERVHDLSDEIPVNLVDVGACSESLRRAIDREAQPL